MDVVSLCEELGLFLLIRKTHAPDFPTLIARHVAATESLIFQLPLLLIPSLARSIMNQSLTVRCFLELPVAVGVYSTSSPFDSPVSKPNDNKADNGRRCQDHTDGVFSNRRLALLDLPTEIHLSVLDLLDRIDSTCLGLTNRYFYAIHRRRHGTVPLSARRDGPNDLEWAWRLARRRLPASPKSGGQAGKNEETPDNPHENQCRKCGTAMCELSRHLRAWMPRGLEYCAVSGKYGASASPGASSYCYKRSPRHPRRCGRHHPKKAGTDSGTRTPAETGIEGTSMDFACDDEKHSIVVDVQELLTMSRL